MYFKFSIIGYGLIIENLEYTLFYLFDWFSKKRTKPQSKQTIKNAKSFIPQNVHEKSQKFKISSIQKSRPHIPEFKFPDVSLKSDFSHLYTSCTRLSISDFSLSQAW